MTIVVATFGQDSDADGFGSAVRDLLGVKPEAISMARTAAYREPHDGHVLIVVEVEPSQRAAAEALVGDWHGQLHEPPGRATS